MVNGGLLDCCRRAAACNGGRESVRLSFIERLGAASGERHTGFALTRSGSSEVFFSEDG